MSYKDIEKSREIRLWIGQVIIPAVGGSIFLLSNPNTRKWINDKVNTIKGKFHKKEENNLTVFIGDKES